MPRSFLGVCVTAISSDSLFNYKSLLIMECTKPNCDCMQKYADKKGIDVYEIKHGYPCLAPEDIGINQKSIPDTIPYTDKPDFEKMATNIVFEIHGFTQSSDQNAAIDCTKKGMEKIWNDYCLPLQQRVKELEESLKGEAEKRWLKRHDRDRQEITELRAKIKQLEEKMKL
jgi:hypothetical protein